MIDLTAGFCRMTRSPLYWSQDDLAERSGVTKRTIADFEREARVPFPAHLRSCSPHSSPVAPYSSKRTMPSIAD
jgi:Helix-turn-helix